MTAILRAPPVARTVDKASAAERLAIILKIWWAAYRRRRMESTAIARLSAMSDRQLLDIGLVRSQIEFAVRGEGGRDRQGPATLKGAAK